MKKFLALLLVLSLALTFAMPAFAAEKADRSFEGSAFKLTTADDFSLGTLEGLVIDESVGNGALKLAQGAAEGTYTSDIIGVEAFEYLVASWNADMPLGTTLEISARAYVDMKKEWTSWLSWGVWRAEITRGSAEGEDALAYMNTDTLTISGSDGETASLVQMKATLKANAGGESPVLRQIAATYKNTLDGQGITALYLGDAIDLPERVQLDTPAYSQQIRKNSIAGEMCSATTISVLLNDRGEDVLPEEIALENYDKTYEGFGNWTYSVAAAGAYGYDAYCQYGSFDVLRQELAHGYSVGISVHYSNSASGSYPYVANAPISGTAGHLITVTGYETVDGVDYFFVSDSAAGSDPTCVLRYRADQLDSAWDNRLMYVVHDKEEGAFLEPQRIAAELVADESAENAYKVMVDGEQIMLDSSMDGKMLRNDGGGILACYVEEKGAAAMPEGTKVTTANQTFKYSLSVSEGLLKLNPSSILAGFTGDATIHVFIMLNNGVTYEARLSVAGETQATPAAGETASADTTPEPAATEAAAPAATEAPKESKPLMTPENAKRLIIVAVVAIGAAIVVRIILDKKEKEAKAKREAEQKKKKKK